MQPLNANAKLLPDAAMAQTALQCLPQAALLIDGQGQVVWYNDSAETLFNTDEQDLRGRILPPTPAGQTISMRTLPGEECATLVIYEPKAQLPASSMPIYQSNELDIGPYLRAMTPFALAIQTTDQVYRLVNQKFAHLVGKPIAEIIGRYEAEVINPIHAARSDVWNQRCIRSRSIQQIRMPSPLGEGHLLISKYPLIDEQDSVIGVYTMLQEVTDESAQIDLLSKQREAVFALHNAGDFDSGVQTMLEILAQIEGLHSTGLFVYHPEANSYELSAQINLPSIFNTLQDYYQIGSSITIDRLLNGEPVYFHSSTLLPAGSISPEVVEGLRGMAILPISVNGKSFGALIAGSRSQESLIETLRRLLEAAAAAISQALARKFTQDELTKSEERFRQLFEHAPTALWEEDFSELHSYLEELKRNGVSDLESFLDQHPQLVQECMGRIKIFNINRATLHQLGANSKEVVLTALPIIVGPETMHVFRQELLAIFHGQTSFIAEGINRRMDGKRLDVLLQWNALPGYETSYQRVLVSTTDITERKRFEEIIVRGKREWEAAFDAISELVLLTDNNGVIRRCNKATVTRTGLQFQEILGATIHNLLFSGGQEIFGAQVLEGELELPALNGWFDVHSYQVGENQQNFSRVFILQDITTRKQMEDNLMAAEKMANLGTLAAGVAHELNSPLQVITGMSESLRGRVQTHITAPDQSLDLDRVCRNLDTINRNGWRCAEIVRSLLAYARPAEAEMEVQSLNKVIRDGLLLIEHQLHSWANIEVVTNLDEEITDIPLNRNQIIQVLINLLTNARDAMPNGGEIRVSTQNNPTAEQVLLFIEDQGCGIPDEAREKIFDPFFTTKPIGQGTGLGLSIVMGIINAHRGSISVESQPGQGTIFIIRFPTRQPDVLPNIPQHEAGRFAG